MQVPTAASASRTGCVCSAIARDVCGADLKQNELQAQLQGPGGVQDSGHDLLGGVATTNYQGSD